MNDYKGTDIMALSYKQLWQFYLRYDVREARWYYLSSGKGYFVLFGNYPDFVRPPYSRVWSYSTAKRFYRAVSDLIRYQVENGLDYELVTFVNLFDDSIDPPFNPPF